MGFTLLELLIAISIFAISVSIVYGLYTSVLSTVNHVEARTDQNSRVRIAFTRFNRDLGGLYRGEQGYLVGLDSSDPLPDEPVLEFISRARLTFNPESDPVVLNVIRYYLVPDDQNQTFDLVRSDRAAAVGGAEGGPPPEDRTGERRFIVCTGLKEVRLRYMDRDGDGQTEWDTREGSDNAQKNDERFPAWVDMELVFPGDAGSDGEGMVYSTAVFLRAGIIAFAEAANG